MLLTEDTIVFPGTTIQLEAQGMLEYHWSPAVLFADSGDAVQTVTVDTPTTFYITAYYQDTNIVVNGDFSAGNVNFGSDYAYVASPSPNALWIEGKYAVGINSHDYHNNFGFFTDHTTGNGNFLIVNGEISPNVTVWTQTVQVTPHTDYAFATWLQNICDAGAPARLQFSINNQQIGDVFEASTTTGLWQQFYQIWNSGTYTQAVITILNQNTDASGNDFGLDDISFCPIYPCVDSVNVGIILPLSATDDTIIGCRGTLLAANPTANDTIDSLCGTVYPQMIDTNPHVTVETDESSMTFHFDSLYSGTYDLRYEICCDDRCDTAVMHFIVTGDHIIYYDTICSGEPFQNYGFNIDTSLTQTPGMHCYIDSNQTIYGCDSIISLYLYVLNNKVKIHNLFDDFCENSQTTLQAEYDLQNVEWSTGENVAMIEITEPGIYWVKVFQNDCVATDTIEIEKCCPDSSYLIPNVITPTQQDGLNDSFHLTHDGFIPKTVDIDIFDRWGRRVFRSTTPDFEWDGKVGEKISPGVYYYSLKINHRCHYHGSITVI